MSARAITTVAIRELREIGRDRPALVSSLVYGLWGPLVMGLAMLSLAPTPADERLEIGVVAPKTDDALVRHLTAHGVVVTPVAAAVEAVRQRRVPVAVEFDGLYTRHMAASRPARLTLAFDGTWTRSARQASRARTLVAEYAQSLRDTRLVMRGVAPDAVQPLATRERDTSTVAERAAKPLATLPIFLLLSVFIGGMSLAADVMAGERERGTLESLLVYPVAHTALAGGKAIAVTAVALATMLLTIGVAAIVLRQPRVQAIDLPVGLSPAEGLAIAGTLLPLALAAVALQLLVALRTGTMREAQTQLSYMMFIPMVPGFLLAFGTVDPTAWMRWTPVLGHHLIVAGLVSGEAPSSVDTAVLAGITLVVALLAYAATVRRLSDETVLRRQSA